MFFWEKTLTQSLNSKQTGKPSDMKYYLPTLFHLLKSIIRQSPKCSKISTFDFCTPCYYIHYKVNTSMTLTPMKIYGTKTRMCTKVSKLLLSQFIHLNKNDSRLKWWKYLFQITVCITFWSTIALETSTSQLQQKRCTLVLGTCI